jgi:hypothetical protein
MGELNTGLGKDIAGVGIKGDLGGADRKLWRSELAALLSNNS